MKKITFLSIFLLFLSCDNHDEIDWSSDRIIGSWVQYKEEHLPTKQFSTFLSYYSIMTFKPNGKGSFKSMQNNSINWKNIGQGYYRWNQNGHNEKIREIKFIESHEMVIYGDDSWAFYYHRKSH